MEHARRLAVARQRLSGSRPNPVTTDDIHELVQAIGCLQLDPTAVVARNHLLVVFSRLGPFDPKLVDTLLWDERRLYEFWAHQASIVPTETSVEPSVAGRTMRACSMPGRTTSPLQMVWPVT